MNQEYVENWTKLVENAQQPFKEIAELNVKTIQDLTFIKPDEVANVKKPEELAQKNLEAVIKNGHTMLDYMQKSFQIFEKTMNSALKEAKKKAEQVKK